ncbi:MAG: hypothetical protein JWQ02_270 [Capsulimonas sp.]|nr:hypothetical protein [Capsulimonas sp.]
MRINTPLTSLKDQLITLQSEGYQLLGYAFQNRFDLSIIEANKIWVMNVTSCLDNDFPTKKEVGQFLYTPCQDNGYDGMHSDVELIVNLVTQRISILIEIIRSISEYYEFEPENKRIYIQSIDSFVKVRSINHQQVASFLDNGVVDLSEKQVKEGLLAIIGQSYVPTDWGGETEDICTSQLVLNGARVQASFALKGPGAIKGVETHTSNYGKNGDQLQRMVSIRSKLYVVQSVKTIANDVVTLMDALVEQQRVQGNYCHYCIIDGQDTATLFYAYSLLNRDK